MKTEINEKEFISQLKSKNNEYDRLSFLISMLDWKMDLGNEKFVQIISLRMMLTDMNRDGFLDFSTMTANTA